MALACCCKNHASAEIKANRPTSRNPTPYSYESTAIQYYTAFLLPRSLHQSLLFRQTFDLMIMLHWLAWSGFTTRVASSVSAADLKHQDPHDQPPRLKKSYQPTPSSVPLGLARHRSGPLDRIRASRLKAKPDTGVGPECHAIGPRKAGPSSIANSSDLLPFCLGLCQKRRLLAFHWCRASEALLLVSQRPYGI